MAVHDANKLIFDFGQPGGMPERKIFTGPIAVIQASQLDEVTGAIIEVDQWIKKGCYAAGYVAYEAAPAFDPACAVKAGTRLPLVWFGIYEGFESEEMSVRNSDQQKHFTDNKGAMKGDGQSADFSIGEWIASVSEREYRQNIEQILEAIARGDTYQVNYTMRLTSQFSGNAYSYYERLSRAQQSCYHAYLNTEDFQILSISPELFFHLSDRVLTTRPMKGTVVRGRWPEEDQRLREWLQQSEKNRAENVMIVDLLRNDLSRVPAVREVAVPKLFEIEQYPTVFQMTSTVTARFNDSPTLESILRALFPCGSITGAPKLSTMKLIAQLEDSPRGVYCGTIGYFTPEREAVFNVAIRTLVIEKSSSSAVYSVGGGITAASTAADEFQEALAKARILERAEPAFSLLETMRLEAGEYFLLERHLQRLLSSARYFSFPLDEGRVRLQLEEHARRHSQSNMIVRLTVNQQGEVQLENKPFPETGANVGQISVMPPVEGASKQLVSLADHPVSRNDIFLFHKTTNRQVYHERRTAAEETFDTLLWNEEGELTEFTFGNLVVEIKGKLYTPPLDCGLLAGTMRSELLDHGTVSEAVIHKEKLHQVTRMWHVNSVRGWTLVMVAATDATW